MWHLEDIQVDRIGQLLIAGGISHPQLYNDLLDHCCSFIEERMDDPDSFEGLLKEAVATVAPGGFREIEEERFFLFHFHKQLTMKRVLFFSGFTTAFLISTGLCFKILHWPGASIMLGIGFAALIVTVLTILAQALKNMASHSPAYRFRIIVGVIAGLLVAVGSIFKLGHMPGANIMTMLGMLLLNFIFMPIFFFQLYRQSIGRIGA